MDSIVADYICVKTGGIMSGTCRVPSTNEEGPKLTTPATKEELEAYMPTVLSAILRENAGNVKEDIGIVSIRLERTFVPKKEAIWKQRWSKAKTESNFDRAEEKRGEREQVERSALLYRPENRQGTNHAYPCLHGTSTP